MARTDEQIAALTQAQRRTDAKQARIDEQIAALTQAQRRTDEQFAAWIKAQARTDERLDRWEQLIIRGNTDAAERHAEIIERLDRLEGTKGLS